jgi:hypothetical protein
MPSGVYEHSKIRGRKRPEHSKLMKQRVSRGIHPLQHKTREQIEKQRLTLKKKYASGELINAMKGKTRADNIIRNKLMNQKGINNGNWKGEKAITPLIMRLRTCSKYNLWRLNVFKRDNYICQICNKRGGNLNVDHIESFSKIVRKNNIKTFEEGINCEGLWDLNNGRTLCFECHIKTENFANKSRNRH